MFFSRKIGSQITIEKDAPGPFYFKRSEGSRIVVSAWTADTEKLKTVFYAILAGFPEIAGVLIKSIKSSDGEHIVCDNYYGKDSLALLQKVFKAGEQYLFEDGNHQIYVRKLNSDEYLLLDEHGMITANLKTDDPEKVFLDAGFVEQPAKHIMGLPHQHNSFNGAQRALVRIITELGLKSI